jgi:hypothetical protein
VARCSMDQPSNPPLGEWNPFHATFSEIVKFQPYILNPGPIISVLLY